MTTRVGPRSVYALIVIGVLAVSTSAVLVKLSAAPPVALAFWRVAGAWLFLSPVVLSKGWSDLLRMTGRDVGWSLLSGLFLAAHYGVWFLSLTMTSVASSTVLVTTQPIWVLLISYVLWRERVAPKALAGIVLALLGVYFIGAHSFTNSEGQVLGDVLAVLAALLVSGYLLIGQRLRTRVALLPYVFFVYGAAAFGLFCFAYVTGVPLLGYGGREWALFVALAVVPTLFGQTVFNWALQYVPASIVSVSILGEPVGAIVLALFLLGEVPAFVQIAGGGLILFGIGLFLHFKDSRRTGNSLHNRSGGDLHRGQKVVAQDVAGPQGRAHRKTTP